MYHQRFAGNCFVSPSERCFSDGLGPEAFDCSGFILRTLCDVTGATMDTASKVRHVREMWQAALGDVYPYRIADLAAGTLLVTKRFYTIDGEHTEVAGHIGIVTDTEPMSFLHASPTAGLVEERPLRRTDTILGGIAISL